MPDDIPLEGPSRRMSPYGTAGDEPDAAASGSHVLGAGTSGSHAWEAFRGWEVLFAVSLAVAVFSVLLDSGVPTWARAVSITLLFLCTIAYLLLGRPAIKEGDHDGSRRSLLYWALILMAFVPAAILSQATMFTLFALCPQAFMMLRQRTAVVMVLLINLIPALQFALRRETSITELLIFTVTAAISVTFALIFGPWITRIIRQSAERAHLIEELRASRIEVARLSAERGALAERARLAGEIHDTLAQGFTSIIMLIQAAEAQADPSRHLTLAVQTARENLAEARALIAELGPPSLNGSTLEEALRRVTGRFGEELDVETSFAVEGPSPPLPPSTEVVLLRAAQEALANVRKHAAATSVAVLLRYGEADVALTVADDGVGFADDGSDASPGFGLRSMRARVEQEGGTFTVESAPGRGTSLTVTMRPIPRGPGV
ncbi:sensor histidine kinase [Sphaerimonospora sp. CA-214678]|uniref:sensor histidine kinase n=1 Tax=Sphaerimonospora sp. CA-214678 TaxID=3240029 RepID=UPI003D8F2059